MHPRMEVVAARRQPPGGLRPAQVALVRRAPVDVHRRGGVRGRLGVEHLLGEPPHAAAQRVRHMMGEIDGEATGPEHQAWGRCATR